MNRVETVKNIINKIQNKWSELQKDFYICYSVKELAYKIAYDLLEEYYGQKNINEIEIYYKKMKDKTKIAICFEQEICLIIDIWFSVGLFEDCGLHCGNATIVGKLPQGYKEFEDSEEE